MIPPVRHLLPLLLVALGPVLAQEPGPLDQGWRARKSHTAEWRPRLELAGQLLWLLPGTKTKQGPAAFAHTIHLEKDAHLPIHLVPAWRVLGELQTPIRLAFGGEYGSMIVDGPRRHVHYKGLTLGTTFHPGGSQLETRLELQHASAHVRFVIFDDDRLHLSVGSGAAWAGFRLGTSARQLGHESRRVDVAFGPTINYRVSWRLAEPVSLFLESTTGLLAPLKLTALYSSLRLGALWHVAEGLCVITALETVSAGLEDHDDRWGGRPTGSHRFEQASWASLGLEVGLQLRF